MSAEHRFEAEAVLRPGASERLIGGGSLGLVTLRLFDGPGVADSSTGEPVERPVVSTDLRPQEARQIAARLLVLAEQAERRAGRR